VQITFSGSTILLEHTSRLLGDKTLTRFHLWSLAQRWISNSAPPSTVVIHPQGEEVVEDLHRVEALGMKMMETLVWDGDSVWSFAQSTVSHTTCTSIVWSARTSTRWPRNSELRTPSDLYPCLTSSPLWPLKWLATSLKPVGVSHSSKKIEEGNFNSQHTNRYSALASINRICSRYSRQKLCRSLCIGTCLREESGLRRLINFTTPGSLKKPWSKLTLQEIKPSKILFKDLRVIRKL
jgi:hypothetical protein